jgi:hypothetical protein
MREYKIKFTKYLLMKQFKYVLLLTVITIMSSCASIGPLLMKDSSYISQALHHVDLDSVIYYHIPSVDSKRHAVHISEVLSGIDFNNRSGRRYYQELPTLPKDTIVDIAGSLLVPRVSNKSRNEYVLSCSANEQYVIPSKHLLSFYEKHVPEAYALHKKGQTFAKAALGIGIGALATIGAGATLLACCEQVVGYETITGSFGFSHIEPIYGRNEQIFHAGISLVSVGFGCFFVASGLGSMSVKKKRDALNLYNIQAEQTMPKLTLNAHVSGNGIGVSLQF